MDGSALNPGLQQLTATSINCLLNRIKNEGLENSTGGLERETQ